MNTNLKWLCVICQISMAADSRDSHVAGKKHAKKASQATISPAAVPASISVPTLSTSKSTSSVAVASVQWVVVAPPNAPILQWRSEYCDLCEISIYTHSTAARDIHVRGVKHQAKLAETNAARSAHRPITSTARPSDSPPARTVTPLAQGRDSAAPLGTSGGSSGGLGDRAPSADGGDAVGAGDGSDDDDGSSDGWSDDFKDNSDESFAGRTVEFVP